MPGGAAIRSATSRWTIRTSRSGRGAASGPVRAKLAADGIAHIVLLQAKSNATPDVVVKLLRRAIGYRVKLR